MDKCVRLDAVCNLIMGQSPDSGSYNTEGRGYPFFQGNADFGELYPKVRVWCDAPTKLVDKGTLLISVRAPIGALNFANERCCIGRGLAGISTAGAVDLKYIFYNLLFLKDVLNSKGTGSTFKAISKGILGEIAIKELPLNRQQEVVTILDSLMQVINKYKKCIAQLDMLVKSRFVEMFGTLDLANQEKSWRRLGDITTMYTGTTPDTHESDNWDGDVLWITPAELSSKSFMIYDTERKITTKGMRSKSLSLMPKNTVLLSTRAPIGKVAITGVEMCCNQGFKNFYCDDDIINPIYLYTLLKNNTEFLNSCGTGTTFKEISKRIAEEIKVPVADIFLQNAFADFVHQVDKLKVVA